MGVAGLALAAGAAPGQHVGASTLAGLKPEHLAPPLRLGQRVEEVRKATRVVPAVVVVRDAGSYLAAIGSWTPTRRFPVLIDDGSERGRQDIARFVRAFAPRAVVRFGSAAGWTSPSEAEIRAGVLAAWGAGDEAAMWKGRTPAGLVVTDRGDPAWTAAAALAAFRGQGLFFRKAPGDLAGVMTPGDADPLCADIEQACEALARHVGGGWRGLGDVVDAVTICQNCPAKVSVGGADVAALTDRVGRLGTTDKPGDRWAWCGQITGSAAACAYQAACALFLTPATAWVFDGYPGGRGWDDYDGTAAANVYLKLGMRVTLDDAPKHGLREWRGRGRRAIDADLIVVNTKGNSDFFDLEPGHAATGDVPLLDRPAILEFTHSWSLQWPARRDTIGGRWLERGVYAYAGSVQEPYLQAFVTPEGVARRLGAGGVWGAVARQDAGPFTRLWRIAVLGDPLLVLGDPLARVDEPLPLAGARDMSEDLASLLQGERFVDAVRLLEMLGRDADVRKLALALLGDAKHRPTPEVAAAAIPASARLGERDLVASLYARLTPELARDPVLRDMLWLSAGVVEGVRIDQPQLDLLRDNLRDDQIEADALALAQAWGLRTSRAQAAGLLIELKARYPREEQRQALDRALANYRAR